MFLKARHNDEHTFHNLRHYIWKIHVNYNQRLSSMNRTISPKIALFSFFPFFFIYLFFPLLLSYLISQRGKTLFFVLFKSLIFQFPFSFKRHCHIHYTQSKNLVSIPYSKTTLSLNKTMQFHSRTTTKKSQFQIKLNSKDNLLSTKNKR